MTRKVTRAPLTPLHRAQQLRRWVWVALERYEACPNDQAAIAALRVLARQAERASNALDEYDFTEYMIWCQDQDRRTRQRRNA